MRLNCAGARLTERRLQIDKAPDALVAWMNSKFHYGREASRRYRYHPRSDRHSVALCRFVLSDVLRDCADLATHGRSGRVTAGLNHKVTAPGGRGSKHVDLAVGLPVGEQQGSFDKELGIRFGVIGRLLIGCEAKAVMTEHVKSKPRVFDELSSSHEIVHRMWPGAIACGIVVVNSSKEFVSPTRQKSRRKLTVTQHRQPQATASMIEHLRKLPVRQSEREVGFDALGVIVLDFRNDASAVRLVEDEPAPQRGDPLHYESLLERIVTLYRSGFSDLIGR